MPADPVVAVVEGETPLTARSVVASTLLGIDPPELPARLLVRSGELFGIAEGTTRVAISRMTSSGELTAHNGTYRLSGPHLVARQSRQTLSRVGNRNAWNGTWTMAVVVDGDRAATDRVALRRAASSLRLAERREGVWLRPDNLPDVHAATQPDALAIVDAQCERYQAAPVGDPISLAGDLWDLDAWRDRAQLLRAAVAELVDPLQKRTGSPAAQPAARDRAAAREEMPKANQGETSPGPRRPGRIEPSPKAPHHRVPAARVPGLLGSAFVVSAAALRHFQLDPLLPDELVGPHWPGAALRADYEVLDHVFKAAWADHFTSGS